MANCHTTGRAFKPSDFMPQYVPQEPDSEEHLRLMAIKANTLLGGTVR